MARRISPKGKKKKTPVRTGKVERSGDLDDRNRNRRILILAGAAALAVSLAIYILRLDRVAGLIVDDAWYVLLAKALATGQGYTLINSPTPGITPLYPPGFPALLSIFYRLSPDFPDNVCLLKSVSIAAMIALGFLSFRYFERYRALPTYVAFALAFTTAIYPALVFLATSTVMSECVFTLTQLAAILELERAVRRDASGRPTSSAWADTAIGGALASFAFLTRSAGVGLLLGGAIYLLKERLPKQAGVFAAVVAIGVGPWTLYSRSHTPTLEQRIEQGGSIVLPYTTQFWQRLAGRSVSGTITIAELPERVWNNLLEIGKDDFGAFVLYSSYRPLEPGESMHIGDAAARISLFVSLLALAGYVATVRERVTLAEIVTPLQMGVPLLWAWEQYRLLLPLLPFLLFYVLMGVRWIAGLWQRLYAGADSRDVGAAAIPLLATSWIFVVSALYANYQYIQRKLDPAPEYRTRWIRTFEENEAFIRYVGENIPTDEPLVTQNPALVNLYTGHKTIASNDPAGRWEVWKRLGVRYAAMTSLDPVQLDANDSRYPTLHRTSGRLGLRLLDLGPPSSRPAYQNGEN